jgi:hypothetical protein
MSSCLAYSLNSEVLHECFKPQTEHAGLSSWVTLSCLASFHQKFANGCLPSEILEFQDTQLVYSFEVEESENQGKNFEIPTFYQVNAPVCNEVDLFSEE